jgi:hypothetical protein
MSTDPRLTRARNSENDFPIVVKFSSSEFLWLGCVGNMMESLKSSAIMSQQPLASEQSQS